MIRLDLALDILSLENCTQDTEFQKLQDLPQKECNVPSSLIVSLTYIMTWNNTGLKRKGSYFFTIARMKLVINKCTLRKMDCFSATWNPPKTEETTVKATEWRSVHPSEFVYDILLCRVLISQWHTPKKCQQFVHKSCPVYILFNSKW